MMAHRHWQDEERGLLAKLLAEHHGSFDEVFATGLLPDRSVKALDRMW